MDLTTASSLRILPQLDCRFSDFCQQKMYSPLHNQFNRSIIG